MQCTIPKHKHISISFRHTFGEHGQILLQFIVSNDRLLVSRTHSDKHTHQHKHTLKNGRAHFSFVSVVNSIYCILLVVRSERAFSVLGNVKKNIENSAQQIQSQCAIFYQQTIDQIKLSYSV